MWWPCLYNPLGELTGLWRRVNPVDEGEGANQGEGEEQFIIEVFGQAPSSYYANIHT